MISIPRELASDTLLLAIKINLPEGLRGTRCFNADVFRVGELRDDLVGGVGASINFDETTIYEMRLPDNLASGLYKLTSFRVDKAPPDGEEYVELLDRSGPFGGCLHFVISESGKTGKNPSSLAEAQYAARHLLITEPQTTSRALLLRRPQSYSGFVLCHGAVLHARQDLRGISLVPYGQGLDYQPLLNSASEFTLRAWGFAIAHDPRIAEDYARQTTTCAVLFHRVNASDETDALSYVANQAEDVVTIIGLDRGFKPVPFAAFVFDGANYHGYFYYGRYTGNLLSPFSPGQVGASIEMYLPKIRKSPRARLLLETYAQATSERDYAFRHFRYWALLELIAKDVVASDTENIIDAHGNIINDNNGRAVTTRGAAAKVYKYLFQAGSGSTSGSLNNGSASLNFHIEAKNPVQANPSDEVFPMWSVVGALYETRNQVAHTGTFMPDVNAPAGSRLALASRFYKHPSELLFRFLKDETWLATLRELNKL